MKQTEKRFAFAGKRIAALPEAAISQQGMDVYGSLAFLLHHGGSCDVLHLNTKQKVSSFILHLILEMEPGRTQTMQTKLFFALDSHHINLLEHFHLCMFQLGMAPVLMKMAIMEDVQLNKSASKMRPYHQNFCRLYPTVIIMSLKQRMGGICIILHMNHRAGDFQLSFRTPANGCCTYFQHDTGQLCRNMTVKMHI